MLHKAARGVIPSTERYLDALTEVERIGGELECIPPVKIPNVIHEAHGVATLFCLLVVIGIWKSITPQPNLYSVL